MTSNEHHLDLYICFSPSTHSLASIQAAGFPATNGKEDSILSTSSTSISSKIFRIQLATSTLGKKILNLASQLTSQIDHTAPFDSILVVMDFSWSQLHLLGQVISKYSVFEPLKKFISNEDNTELGSFMQWKIPFVYPVIQFPSYLNSIFSPPSWQEALQTVFLDFSTYKHDNENSKSSLSTFPSVMAVGNKGTGKSTFNKMLVNLLLSSFPKVAFLDLDPGATEITEPGVISLSIIDFPLLGPGYMYCHRPSLAQYLGSTSPLVHPEMYLSQVTRLLKEYKVLATHMWNESHQKQFLPLVINTMGWVRSLGYELLQQVIQEIIPTHAIILESKDNTWLMTGENSLLPLSTKIIHAEVIRLANKSKFNTSELHAVSFTYKLMNHSTKSSLNIEEKEPWLQPFPLTSPLYPVYALPLDQLRIITPHVEIPYEHLLYSINATLVGLVALLPDEVNPEDDLDEIQQAYGGPEYLFSLPRHHRYMGIGIVRGISGPTKSSSNRYLYLSTPLDPSLLQHVKTIVRGDLELVNWLYTWGLPNVSSEVSPGPYMTLLSSEGPGSAVLYSRKRVKRLYSARKEANGPTILD
ncbi:Polynucleotide 5'-hydroxyl-kinase nol9 [Coelomomyces lativittatus]|nr:Polynucleotide 5'-hydroxyl-kinase nol9 [Coelomomyces lativittatus]KAJ1509269.1 Polynucleotide 5'-hydroxyl-kinase nol9 [Coelomomyces lativittatus]